MLFFAIRLASPVKTLSFEKTRLRVTADTESVNNYMFLYIIVLVKNTAGKFWGKKS